MKELIVIIALTTMFTAHTAPRIPIPKNNLSRQASAGSTLTTASEPNEESLFCRLGITPIPELLRGELCQP